MNDLERFRGTLEYRKTDRAPFHEFIWPAWPETAERWADEGGYVARKTDLGCDTDMLIRRITSKLRG